MSLCFEPEKLIEYLTEIFPQIKDEFSIESITESGAKVRLLVSDKHLRPGGTVSGPAIFALADVSVYISLLAVLGREALAVTTNCSIDFMRKPSGEIDLISNCRLLKVGKKLAVGDVLICSAGKEEPVARASLTYSIP